MADGVADKAAQGVAGGILRMQRKFSEGMGRWSASWSKKGKLIFLGCVSIVFLSLSVIAITLPFVKENKARTPVQIRVIHPPPVELSPRITEEEFQRIQIFKSKLDSATIKRRPGLMDSIRMVEELFYSNK